MHHWNKPCIMLLADRFDTGCEVSKVGQQNFNFFQQTIRQKVVLQGVGLHSGSITKIEILPARPNYGIVFQRIDFPNASSVKAHSQNISCSELSTSIGEGESKVQTIEHLIAMKINGIDFILKAGTAHRAGLIMRGKNLSHKISDPDPHIENVKIQHAKPLDNSKQAKFTAQVLNKFLDKAHILLKNNPENKKRKQKGLLQANYLFTRGAGYVTNFPPFKDTTLYEIVSLAGK